MNQTAQPNGVFLNDAQPQVNPTWVRCVHRPMSVEDVLGAVRVAARNDRQISVAGGRHAMGAQQFGSGNLHLDMTGFARILSLDTERGLVTVEAGIMWPQLIEELHRLQPAERQPWVIREKQTGVDNVTLGGSLSANIHGRGLKCPPLVHDIESFDIVTANGSLRHCSRSENGRLFSLAIGGYGLFGIIVHVTLRLVRRQKVRRHVEIIPVCELLGWYDRRVQARFLYGDCQYSVDLTCDEANHPGVFACYEPIDPESSIPVGQHELSEEDWADLYRCVRTDKPRAFATYCDHYRRSDGQVYWSDTHQLAGKFTGHRTAVDPTRGTEMITEVYVRHEDLVDFLTTVRRDFAAHNVDMTYGTVRFIEPDEETFLPWARRRSACIVCNLHIQKTGAGLARARGDFLRILDRVVQFGGSFYLTYHRWAERRHLTACYPELPDFFRLKRTYDPNDRIQSDWYRHYAPMFANKS